MKTFKLLILFLFIIILFVTGIYVLSFDNNIASSKYSNIKTLLKRNNGGIVFNTTNKPITIIDNSYKITLPAHKSSREIGIFDADGIVIDSPTVLNSKVYDHKIFKFCDFARVKVINKKNKVEFQPLGPIWFCRLIHDYNIYNSIQEGFLNK